MSKQIAHYLAMPIERKILLDLAKRTRSANSYLNEMVKNPEASQEDIKIALYSMAEIQNAYRSAKRIYWADMCKSKNTNSRY